MSLFDRTLENCAKTFNLLIPLFLGRFCLILLAVFLFPPAIYLSLIVSVILAAIVGLLAYQLDYHPVLAVLSSLALFVPYASLIIFLLLYFQGKSRLRNQGYISGLLGARPGLPKQDAVAEIDQLIKDGQIRVPENDQRTGN